MSQDEFKLQKQSADQTQDPKKSLLRNSQEKQQLYAKLQTQAVTINR